MRTAARPWMWYLLGTGFDGRSGGRSPVRVPWGATLGAAASSWLLGGGARAGESVFLVYPLTQRQAEQPLAFMFLPYLSLCNDRCRGWAELVPSSCVSPRWLLKGSPAFLARAVHIWKFGALFLPSFVSGLSRCNLGCSGLLRSRQRMMSSPLHSLWALVFLCLDNGAPNVPSRDRCGNVYVRAAL